MDKEIIKEAKLIVIIKERLKVLKNQNLYTKNINLKVQDEIKNNKK